MNNLQKEKLVELGKKYKALEIWHFGSSTMPGYLANDIDIAIILKSSDTFFALKNDLNTLFPANRIDFLRYTTIHSTTEFHFLICTERIKQLSEFNSIKLGKKIWQLSA